MSLVDMMEGEKSGISGVAVGIVTNNKDPDGMGRVRLKFPWRDAGDESHWARIAAPMAGNKMGVLFIPEVGDEVLVAFDNGDIHHPYVLGSLWNGKEAPPATNGDGKNNLRIIKSRSGHQITLDDSDGKERIEIKSKAGHSIVLDDASGSEKISITDKAGSDSITFDSSQNSISIKSSSQLKLSSQSIEISADSTMTIKSGGTLTIKGSLVQIN